MKRIIVYSTQHMQTGGIESHLQEFCRELSSAGVIIDLFILNSSMLPETEAYYHRICRRVYFGKYKGAKTLSFFLLLFKIKLAFKPGFTLYTNGQGNSIGIIGKFLNSRLWVHHHHTSGDGEDQAGWSKSYIKALRNATKLISCSPSSAIEISKFLARTVEFVPCFSKGVVIPETRKPSKYLKFGYYGRLIPEKGIETLCRLSQDPDLTSIEFHIWGFGERYPVSYFKAFTNTYYHGSYSGHEELSHVVGVLDAFLLISTHGEGLPISLLEAMSAGLPWIATDRGGISDIACDPTATLVISASPTYSETKEAILLLAEQLYAGNVSRANQIKLYNMEFASNVLIKKWFDALCTA